MKQTSIILAPYISKEPHSPTILSEGQRIKSELLALAGAFREDDILTEHIFEQGKELSGRIDGHLKQVDGDRETVGAPFYQTWKAVNELAAKHRLELVEAKRKLDRMLGAFEEQRRQRLLADEQALIEDRRKLEETTLPLGESLDLEEQIQTRQQTLQVAVQKPTGGALRHELDIQINDLKALYAAHPHLILMKPDMTSIKYHINHYLKEGQSLPGVTFTKRPIFSGKTR